MPKRIPFGKLKDREGKIRKISNKSAAHAADVMALENNASTH